jgi:hypothetical protein
MKLNLTAPILNEEGEQTMYKGLKIVKKMIPKKIKDEEGKIIDSDEMIEIEVEETDDKKSTLGILIAKSLLRKTIELRDMEPDTVEMRYDLLERIKKSDEIEITEEELTEIRMCLCQKFETFYAGQAMKIIKEQLK